MKMGRRGQSSCQDVNRKNKSLFSRCVMAQNSFSAGDEFLILEGGKFAPLHHEDTTLQSAAFTLYI